jgi:hypothetical protein
VPELQTRQPTLPRTRHLSPNCQSLAGCGMPVTLISSHNTGGDGQPDCIGVNGLAPRWRRATEGTNLWRVTWYSSPESFRNYCIHFLCSADISALPSMGSMFASEQVSGAETKNFGNQPGDPDTFAQSKISKYRKPTTKPDLAATCLHCVDSSIWTDPHGAEVGERRLAWRQGQKASTFDRT